MKVAIWFVCLFGATLSAVEYVDIDIARGGVLNDGHYLLSYQRGESVFDGEEHIVLGLSLHRVNHGFLELLASGEFAAYLAEPACIVFYYFDSSGRWLVDEEKIFPVFPTLSHMTSPNFDAERQFAFMRLYVSKKNLLNSLGRLTQFSDIESDRRISCFFRLCFSYYEYNRGEFRLNKKLISEPIYLSINQNVVLFREVREAINKRDFYGVTEFFEEYEASRSFLESEK